MAVRNKIKILKKHLILCEGLDEYNFMIAYLNSSALAFDERYANDIQVFNFGGNEELNHYLLNLKNTEGFLDAASLLIIRDAERNAQQAVQQIQGALQSAELVVPKKPCAWALGKPAVGFLLFPACSDIVENGTLEDLCLQILKEEQSDIILDDVDKFMESLKENRNREFPHEFKTKLHTYFSVTDDYVTMKIGEAARAGAFDWNNDKLSTLRDFIMEGLRK